ncbi:MAG: DMT family transporter [Clostridia bacterium]|nr:DMT family transporter [Clostridia bacterium]
MGEKTFVSKYAKFLVPFAVICGSMSGILGSLVSAPAIVIGFGRLTVALPFFAIPVLVKDMDSIKAMTKRDWIFTILAGIFLFGHFFTWFTAVKLTQVTSAAVLASLHPLVVLFCTIFIFKRKVSIKQIIAILFIIFGAGIITFSDSSAGAAVGSNPLMGDLFAFVAGVCMGIYFQFGNEARANVKGSTYVFLCFLACWVCFGIALLVTQTSPLGYPTSDYLYIVAMAFICQIGSHALFNLCLGHVNSIYVSTWESGDALFATFLSIIILAQAPSAVGWLGCIIATAALVYYNYLENKNL